MSEPAASAAPGDRRPVATREAPWARRIAAGLAAAGVSPNTLSGASIAFAAFGAAAYLGVAAAHPVAGLVGAIVGMQGRLLCNLFDGMVAVEGGKASATGELWNDLPDRISDTLLLVAAGVAAGRPALGVLAAILALHVAYVRVLGRASGAGAHFLGPMAKQHRMALLTAANGAALVATPWSATETVLSLALLAVCAGCVLTAARRLAAIRDDLLAKATGGPG